jgi:hypothetical protein
MLIRHRPDLLLEYSERSDRRDCQRDVGMDMRICLKLLSFVSSLETSVVSFVLSVFSMFCSISELDVCAKELVCRSQVKNSIVVSSCVRLRRFSGPTSGRLGWFMSRSVPLAGFRVNECAVKLP